MLALTVKSYYVDVALKLLYHHKKELALATDKNALHALARNPSLLDEAKQPLFRRLLGTSKFSIVNVDAGNISFKIYTNSGQKNILSKREEIGPMQCPLCPFKCM